MGIFGFTSLLKKCPEAVGYNVLSILENKKVGIDFLGFWHTLWSVAHRGEVNSINILTEEVDLDKIFDRFVSIARSQLDKLLKLGITPVFINDGTSSKEKKEHTGVKRQKIKQTKKEKIQDLRDQIEIGGLIKCRHLIGPLKTAILNSPRFSWKHSLKFVQLIKDLGFPFLEAKGLTGEADKLCAYLCQKGYVQGVISKDRDLLTFGAPYIITGFAGYKKNQYTKKQEMHIETIVLDVILKKLNITYTQFVDICILAGCDYNEKTEGKGIITTYNLISKYGSIEDIPKEKMNMSKTNYQTARKYFLEKETYEELCVEPDYKLDINFNVLENLEETLIKYKLGDWAVDIQTYYARIRALQSHIVIIKTKKGVIRMKVRTPEAKILTEQKETVKTKINQVQDSDLMRSLLD